jgi:radical SAM superfamily enzyme YgiQ (UPF0313 family)
MKKKMLFIQPTIYDDQGRLIKKRKLYFAGLAYPLLAAMLPADWECAICLETIEDIPWDSDAGVVACGGMGHALNRGLEIADEFRKRGKTVIMGGPMASLAPEFVRGHCDRVVIGDAETVWDELIADLERGSLQAAYHKPLGRLSTPLPRYELLTGKNIGDFLPVQAARGCPHSCRFCSIYCMYRNSYLKRDLDEVVRDIRRIKELGFKKFLLLDDNIAADAGYMAGLCREIQKLDMEWMSQCSIEIARQPKLLELVASSGCTALSFGLESICQESLNSIDKSWCRANEYPELLKKIRDAGIEISTEMMVGLDADTPESLRRTADLLLDCKVMLAKFYILTPIPGTDLYHELLAAGRITEQDPARFSPSRSVIRHPLMSREELTALFWELYTVTYSYKNILKRTLLLPGFWKKPKSRLFYLLINLYYRWQIRQGIAPNIL